MLRLPDSWVWDFWFADDGEQHHLFFLYASRALHDPDRRHLRASVGHAVSTDLSSWTRLPDAIVRGDAPAHDDIATWTGSVVRGPDGLWYMFYTGATGQRDGLVQSIGLATSSDLVTWRKHPGNPVARADRRWYERLEDGSWVDEAWRDPWVFVDRDGYGWHMLITARANHGAVDDRGVVGHAFSRDLTTWEVLAPLSSPGAGFGQLEVLQSEVVDGRPVILFSCLRGELSAARKATGSTGGIWTMTADCLTGPFDPSTARQLTDDSLYVGRLVQRRDGRWVMLAFHNIGPDGEFVGEISDPIAVEMADSGLILSRVPAQEPS
jgi:beta-fructofuranosidase